MAVRAGKRRGTALVMAILVVLVLTLVGVGLAFLTETEDAISGNARLSREAFYAAETGLRRGETLMGQILADQIAATTLLSTSGPITVPGGGFQAVPLVYNGSYANIVLAQSAGSSDASAYSLYVRNNLEDKEGATADGDNVLNLVVVGSAVTLDTSTTPPTITRVLATRILEEQFSLVAQSLGGYAQSGAGEAGTGSVRTKR